MDDDERAWKQAVYENVIADPQLKSLAWGFAENARRDGEDPELGAGDMEAARRYLKKCMFNMSMVELQQVTNAELAGLLARGALGAARFRTMRPAVGTQSSTTRRRRRTADR